MKLELIHKYLNCENAICYLLDVPEVAQRERKNANQYGTTVIQAAYQVLKYSDGYLYGCHGGELRWDSQVWQAIRQTIEQS